jgi:outer membrane immunogenic protein
MKTSKLYRYLVSIFGTWALFATVAQAADNGPYASPAPVEDWTGFSVSVGGGVGFLNADVNAKASRTDEIGCSTGSVDCPLGALLREIDQTYSSSLSDLGDTGGFFTVQGAYDYQFAPRWVAGAFVDADWSGINGDAKQTENSLVSFFCADPAGCENQPVGSFATSNGSIDTKVRTDWNVSVGGRIGWLANQGTLLYLLAAYTHADLSDAQVKVSIPDPNDLVGVLLGGAPGTSPFANSATSLLVKLPDSLDGWSLGGGGEAKLGGPWSVKLEYRWTHLEGGSGHANSNTSQCCFQGRDTGGNQLFRNINSNASANFDADEQTVRGALVYHFWSGSGSYGG